MANKNGKTDEDLAVEETVNEEEPKIEEPVKVEAKVVLSPEDIESRYQAHLEKIRGGK